jgi:hypothetical protein
MPFSPRPLPTLLVMSLALSAASAPGASARDLAVLQVRAKTSIWWLDADTPPPGSSKGDALFGSDVLRGDAGWTRTPTGAVVGRNHWRFVYRTPTVAVLSGTAYLEEGTITCRGKVRAGAHGYRLRVVHGSGAFKRANGTCLTWPAPSGAPGAALRRYVLVLR